MGIEKFFTPANQAKKQQQTTTRDSDKAKAGKSAETSAKQSAETRKRKQHNEDDAVKKEEKPLKAADTSSNVATKAAAAAAAPKKRKKKNDDDDYFEPIEGFEDEEQEAPAIARTARNTKQKQKEKDKEQEDAGDNKNKKKNFYQALNREGPRALGTRPLPVGEENCLGGYTFVLSGELETMTKETASDLIKRYGGRITGAVSGKTTFLLRGRDAGETKTAKAKQLGTKILDEDDFYELFKTEKAKSYDEPAPAKGKAKGIAAKGKTAAAKAHAEEQLQTAEPEKAGDPTSNSNLWTEKYKPKTIKDIIGNKELVRKISAWMENWQSSMEKGFPITKDNDGISSYRALLLSGPPGIGKTTTAHVVARTYGYEPLEFNASDVRSKKVLEENITEMLDNRTMTEFFRADKGKQTDQETITPKGKKVVLIMDEVDGMSSGDRGGSAELAQMIRKTKIPVICICNDVRAQKIQPLLRVCYDARFKRTPAQQLRSRIMTIAHREKLNIQPNAIDELVQATRNDLRQIINILSTYRISKSSLNYDEAKLLGKSNEKYTQMTIFEIPIALLSGASWRSKSLNEKYEIYFHDYSLSHLMMFDSYIKSDPGKAARTAKSQNPSDIECNKLKLIAQAAEAIADGDLIDTKIHGSVQQYSLMPVHSIFSCVRPAYYMEGSLAGFKPFFPSWLGQNSKAMKHNRLLNDIRNRMRVHTSANRSEIRANYVPTLSDRIFGNIKEEEYDDAMRIMDNYYLDRENLEALSDLHVGPKKPMSQLSAKAKTTFTKLYNSETHPTLFHVAGAPIKKAAPAAPAEDIENELFEEEVDYGEDVSEEEEEDIKGDKFIKQSENRKRKQQQQEDDDSEAKASTSRPRQKRKTRK